MSSFTCRKVFAALLGTLLALPVVGAHAQGDPHRDGRRPNQGAAPERRPSPPPAQRPPVQRPPASAPAHRPPPPAYHPPAHRPPPAVRPHPGGGDRWSRGQYLPRSYWDRRYYVPNWYALGLPRPLAGYQWVFINGQYVLMQVNTGLIARIIIR